MTDLDIAPGALEYRKATPIGVRFADRIIDMIAVPYDEETRVLHRGRWITETVAPGSFANVLAQHRAVSVNRGHDVERPLGKVARLHPNDPRGLRTEIRVARTAEGDDVLELADEGLLGASVGFAPYPGGESYTPDRTRRRITSAYLGHIAMTGDPAYDGARVLSVRSADPPPPRTPTPLLDQILSERRLAALGLDVAALDAGRVEE